MFQTMLNDRKLQNDLKTEVCLCHFHVLLYISAYLLSLINDTYQTSQRSYISKVFLTISQLCKRTRSNKGNKNIPTKLKCTPKLENQTF